MTATRTPPRLALAITVASLMAALTLTPAQADDGPSVPPGTEPSATAPVEVDPNDPDLKLPEGATLAEPKVLDIKQVVEDQSGDERREDTNADVKFALQAEVLFGKDSAKLNGEAKARISAIAAEIKNQNATRIRVFGFTDNLGSYAHGRTLSRQRANAVQDVLDQELKDSGITYEVRGYSEDYPIASNATESGRKKNRRVEVSFPRGGTDRPALPGHRQLVDAVDDAVVLERDRVEVGGPAHGGAAAEEGVVDDLELQTGQGLAQALVDAETEGHVATGVAADVEPFGLGEDVGLPVAGGARHDDAFAARMDRPPISRSSRASRRWPLWTTVR